MSNMLNSRIHTLLVPVSLVFFIYSCDPGNIQLHNIIVPMVAIVLLSWAVREIAGLFIPQKDGTAIYLSILAVMCLNYGRIFDVIKVLKIGSLVIGKNKWLLALYLFTAIMLAVMIYRSSYMKRNAHALHPFFNVMSIVFIGLSLVSVGIKSTHYLTVEKTDSKAVTGKKLGTGREVVSNSADRPNVLFVIFDSYARNDVLSDYYGFDNSEIMEYLKGKGFQIDTRSRSNYPFTILSLNSLLNMELTHLSEDFVKSKDKNWSLLYSLKHNRVMSVFREHGYNVVSHISMTGDNQTLGNDSWHGRLVSFAYNEVTRAIVHTSILRIMEKELLADPMRLDILHTIEGISQLNNKKEPFFLFAHIVCPHPPYIFNADGSKPDMIRSMWLRGQKLDNTHLTMKQHRDDYLNQVKFINSQIKKIVQTIDINEKTGDRATLIVFQADHGHSYILGDHLIEDKKPPRDCNRLQFSTLSAYRIPEKIKIDLYTGMTTTNVFRVLFNGLFDTHFDLVPDSSFFTAFFSTYEHFYDVTSDAKSEIK